ncbi:MAG: hypothetical protein FWE13_01810 [Firmicutes bacterium]|nr:hypothetical protein [Bacillota bacterium]
MKKKNKLLTIVTMTILLLFFVAVTPPSAMVGIIDSSIEGLHGTHVAGIIDIEMVLLMLRLML